MKTFGLEEGIIITRSQNDTINMGDKIIKLIPAFQFISKSDALQAEIDKGKRQRLIARKGTTDLDIDPDTLRDRG